MLVERSAYANRWRSVAPAAKALFALGGLVASFACDTLGKAAFLASLLAFVTTQGAGVAWRSYLRVALPPLAFLCLGGVSLAISFGYHGEALVLEWLPQGWMPIGELAARSAAALAAMLFLALTTPLTDLIALLRQLKAPSVVLEIMVLCYRTLFVFSAALREMQTAQAARLGYASPRLALRSLAGVGAQLTLQVWQRAAALDRAARSRNNDGALRFLAADYANARRDFALATMSAALLLVFAVGTP